MLGALLKTTLEARARREILLAEAATQRQRMAAYLDAFDPAAHWLDRFLTGLRFVLERPVIPAGLLATLLILKPRRALRIAVLAWKTLSWVRRIRAAIQ